MDCKHHARSLDVEIDALEYSEKNEITNWWNWNQEFGRATRSTVVWEFDIVTHYKIPVLCMICTQSHNRRMKPTFHANARHPYLYTQPLNFVAQFVPVEFSQYPTQLNRYANQDYQQYSSISNTLLSNRQLLCYKIPTVDSQHLKKTREKILRVICIH